MTTKYLFLKTFVIMLIVSINSWGQATIAQWNFNGSSATTIPGGETAPTPSVGAGTAQLIGGTTATFAAGNTTNGTLETEMSSPPNYAWSTTTYAPTGTESKMRGVQFNVSTANQAGIMIKFEQRLSNSSNNTYVVQYTTNKSVANPIWVDAQTFTFTPNATSTGDTWYNARSVDLTSVTALNNNPNVGFRIVSAFDPTANNYVAANSTVIYAGGKVRYDMVQVTSNITLDVTQFQSGDTKFIIYPNPSNKEIVHFNQPQDVEIYDLHGKIILSLINATSFSTSTFQAGTYFIKTDGITKKLIVK